MSTPKLRLEGTLDRLLNNDELLLGTPFPRRIREEGRAEGREEGAFVVSRHEILQAFARCFDPRYAIDEQISRRLESMTDETRLETRCNAMIQSET